MHESEVKYFSQALSDIKNEFYFDAITTFKKLCNEFPDSELCDDAFFNIGLCYFELNQFEKALNYFKHVIDNYPDSKISILQNGNEFGSTSAKCYLGIINCYLATGEINKIDDQIKIIKKYKDSYVMKDGKKVSFFEIAQDQLKKYNEINNL